MGSVLTFPTGADSRLLHEGSRTTIAVVLSDWPQGHTVLHHVDTKTG